MKIPQKTISIRLNYAYKSKEGNYQILLECRNFNTKPNLLRISAFESSGNTIAINKSNIKKGRIVDTPKAGQLNAYFDKIKQRIFLVMDFLAFNGKEKNKKNVEYYTYKSFRQVYEYFQEIDITDPEEVNSYAEALHKSPEEWEADYKKSLELEKELGIFLPSMLIEAIEFYDFPNVDSTVKVILKSYCKSIGHDDISIKLLDKKLLENCVEHAKTMKTAYERGYMLSTLKKFIKKFKSLAVSLAREGFEIDKSIHDYELKAGKSRSTISFNYTEKENVWALTKDEYQRIKDFKLTNKTLQKTRDMFVFQVEAGGLRVNELFRISENNIKKANDEYHLVIRASKTSKILSYTIKPEIISILEKYKYNLHLFKHGTTYNKYLRKLAEKVGLTREVIIMSGDISKDEIESEPVKICKLFTSKAARKAFISILYNDDYTIEQIARITRHSIESINNYISILIKTDSKTMNHI